MMLNCRVYSATLHFVQVFFFVKKYCLCYDGGKKKTLTTIHCTFTWGSAPLNTIGFTFD